MNLYYHSRISALAILAWVSGLVFTWATSNVYLRFKTQTTPHGYVFSSFTFTACFLFNATRVT